jgi:hypothetical protein
LLLIALTMRETGIAASERLKIADEVRAFSFDTACTVRLLRFDNEREQERFKVLGAMLGGSEPEQTAADADIPEAP